MGAASVGAWAGRWWWYRILVLRGAALSVGAGGTGAPLCMGLLLHRKKTIHHFCTWLQLWPHILLNICTVRAEGCISNPVMPPFVVSSHTVGSAPANHGNPKGVLQTLLMFQASIRNCVTMRPLTWQFIHYLVDASIGHIGTQG